MADIQDDREEFRVPVTVFTTVRGVDFRDAAAIADVAVRTAIRSAAVDDEPDCTLHVEHRRLGTLKVRVHHVMETGMAAGNGYLWTEATPKAYREHL